MSIFQKTKGLMLGTRFKRIGDRFLLDVSKVYKSKNIPFEPAWFPVFFLLNEKNKMKVSELAEELEVTQSAASQMISALKKKNLVEFEKDANDKRIKVVCLSDSGKQLLNDILPLWKMFEVVLDELMNKENQLEKMLKNLDEFESSMKEKSLFDRMENYLQKGC